MDWKRIKAEYVAGGISLQKLAEKYRVSFSTIQKKSMEEKWGNLRKKNRRIVEEKIIDSVSSKEVKKAVNIIDVADKLLEKITEFIETVPLSANSVKQLTSAIKDIKDIKGLKSDADSREQEARIKALEKQVQDESPKDREINVNFEGDLSLYSK